MSNQIINLGSAPEGQGGDTTRQAFIKTKANFSELYSNASNTMGVVVHGSNANAARPSSFGSITWIGTIEPANMINNDIWEQVT